MIRVELAYYYLTANMYLAIFYIHHSFITETILFSCSLVIFLVMFHFKQDSRNVYLVNFACYKPDASLMCSKQNFMHLSRISGAFTEESLAFQKKVLERSGLGEKIYLSEGMLTVPTEASMREARKEADRVMFGAVDELFSKVSLNVNDIEILVLNCSLFNPIASLSSAIVNRYKLRSNILSYNLGGMGCSA